MIQGIDVSGAHRGIDSVKVKELNPDLAFVAMEFSGSRGACLRKGLREPARGLCVRGHECGRQYSGALALLPAKQSPPQLRGTLCEVAPTGVDPVTFRFSVE
ncbi:hypothetical protein [Sinomonas atrocyanea]